MKLLAYILNGTPINELVDGYNPELLNGNKPFLKSVNVVQGYSDITSASNWDKFGKEATDYIFTRYEIQVILLAICGDDFASWNNLSADEKFLMAKHILAPKALRRTIVTVEEDYINWKNIIAVNKADRVRLIERMRSKVSDLILEEEMTMASSQAFFRDVFEMTNYYINTNDLNLKLWLTNSIPYLLTGFAQQPYYTLALKNSLMSIYEGETE